MPSGVYNLGCLRNLASHLDAHGIMYHLNADNTPFYIRIEDVGYFRRGWLP